MGPVSAVLGQYPYFDSNIVIYAVEGFSRYALTIKAVLRAMDDGEIIAATGDLTLAETLVKPREKLNAAGEAAILRFLEPTPAMRLASLSRQVLIDAADIRSTSPLKLPDAIHVAAAIALGCTSFLTNDAELRAAPKIRVVLLEELAAAVGDKA